MSEISSNSTCSALSEDNEPPHPVRDNFPFVMCHSESVLPEASGLVSCSLTLPTTSPYIKPTLPTVATPTTTIHHSTSSNTESLNGIAVRAHRNSAGLETTLPSGVKKPCSSGTKSNFRGTSTCPHSSGSVPFTSTLVRTMSSLSPKNIEKIRTVPKNLGNRFLVGNLIGRGSYAKVRDAYDIKHNTVVAIKIFNWTQLKRVPGGDVSLKRELTALRTVTRHPNCVSLIEFWRDPKQGKSYIALDYMPCGTLEGLLLKAGEHPLPLEQARLLFSGLMSGLTHMHQCGIYHRDIKPDNLMLLNNTTLCISDFGTSTTESSTEGIGAPGFQPPEVAANGKAPYADKLDVWAAGITLYIMVTGKYPFPANKSLFQTFKIISSTDVNIPEDLPVSLQELLRGMLTRDPEARFTCEQVTQSTWVNTPDDNADPQSFIIIPPRSTIFTEQRVARFIRDLAPGVESTVVQQSEQNTTVPPPPSSSSSSKENDKTSSGQQQQSTNQKTDESAPNTTTTTKKGCVIQ